MLCAGSSWRPQRPSTASGLRPPTLPALWESGRDRLSGAALASGWEQTAGSGAGDPALCGGERDAADVGHRRRGVRGIHRTTLRALAVSGQAPVEPIRLTQHKRVYRRIDVERLAGVVE